jgi:predicted metal-dependent hydrolase
MLMKAWYRERAKIKFAEIAEPIIQRFKKYHVEPTSLYIQQMENRWGSCTPKGKIILNTELIKAPKPCIQYVITHELCHLLHRNHTAAFYKLLAAEMPDWERWKNKLERLLV